MAAALAACSTFTVPEAARLLGISPRHAYELVRRRDFPVPILALGRRTVGPRPPCRPTCPSRWPRWRRGCGPAQLRPAT